jgi:hypothetical protein
VEAQLRKLSNETNWAGGHLLNIHIAPTASVAMEEVTAANFVGGRGIEGTGISWAPAPIQQRATSATLLCSRLRCWRRLHEMILRFNLVRSSSGQQTAVGRTAKSSCGKTLSRGRSHRFRRAAQFPMQVSRKACRPAGLFAAVQPIGSQLQDREGRHHSRRRFGRTDLTLRP